MRRFAACLLLLLSPKRSSVTFCRNLKTRCVSGWKFSPQSLASECGKNEACSMDILVVVFAKFLFLFGTPATERFLQVTVGVLAADHESNLSGWIGRDGGVSVFNCWEDFLAVFLELGNQWKMEPLVFGYRVIVSQM